ncbi:MAG TPA: ribosome-associated translation inhibitor RaiA [Sporichthyaceae bacterium]|nr:ribosome-associated translation inhibitor RaiA [Sporichthyaceae bacterium]
MEIVVKGRRTEVTDRFRQHAMEKLAKLEKWDTKIISLDVEVCRERNPRQSDVCDRIELTCRSRGPVIRAEAAAADPYAALDLACSKLEVRLRKSADRRRVHHGARTPLSVAAATGQLAESAARNGHTVTTAELSEEWIPGPDMSADGPFVVREKSHRAQPMTLDQALYEMELVGHDFYLFMDSDSGCPGVVYRRHGYDYGVIRLTS